MTLIRKNRQGTKIFDELIYHETPWYEKGMRFVKASGLLCSVSTEKN